MRRRILFGAALAVGAAVSAAHSQEGANIGQQKAAQTVAETVSEDADGKAVATAFFGADHSSHDAGVSVAIRAKAADEAGKKVEVDETTTASTGKRTRIDIEPKGEKRAMAAKAPAAKSAGGGRFHTLVAKYAAEHGVPVALANAVIGIESNWRVEARGRAGEVGLMQIKPATARGLGYSGSIKALYNPETNIRYGMKYLGMAHRLGGGSTCGTILKYNAGHGAKRMNPFSAAYCAKVKRKLGA
jgi:soluble lytic murein transglycosylase-like protein